MILDVTTTAMPRPEIVEATYKSFTKNLVGVDWTKSTCYINIDPLPGKEKEREEVEAVANKYFGYVVSRKPETANYSLAYKWLWMQSDNEFFFNLEDDWLLNLRIHIKDLMKGFIGEQVKAVPLRAYTYTYRTIPTSPSVYRSSFFKLVARYLRGTNNPETQLHDFINDNFRSIVAKRPHLVCAYPYGKNDVVVSDNGRDWLEKSEFVRPQMLDKDDPEYKKKCNFTEWVVK